MHRCCRAGAARLRFSVRCWRAMNALALRSCRWMRVSTPARCCSRDRSRSSRAKRPASLHDRLAALGAEALLDALERLASGDLTPRLQPSEGATYASKIRKEEALIDWSRDCSRHRSAGAGVQSLADRRDSLAGFAVACLGVRLVVFTLGGSAWNSDRQQRGRRRSRNRKGDRCASRVCSSRREADVRRRVREGAPSCRSRARLMSSSARIRASAAKIVAAVAAEGRSLDAALLAADASREERGLLRSLCYDSIRWYIRLDALLDRLLTRPGQKLAPEIRGLAIVGLQQLLHTDIPAHAAVDETVNAARIIGHERAAGMINAVLRRAQREHATMLPTSIARRRCARRTRAGWFVSWKGIGARSATSFSRPTMSDRRSGFGSIACAARRGLSRATASARRNVAASLFDDEALLLERALDVHELPDFAAWRSVGAGRCRATRRATRGSAERASGCSMRARRRAARRAIFSSVRPTRRNSSRSMSRQSGWQTRRGEPCTT